MEKLDILNPYEVAHALKFDIDVLFSNAGIGEAGPVSEIPMDLVRRNYETNVFAPLAQDRVHLVDGRTVHAGRLRHLCSTKHALEAVAEALAEELRPFNIKVQTINPGAYLTGFNETMAESAFLWMDDDKNFNKRADLGRPTIP